jgi:hypothetical protein
MNSQSRVIVPPSEPMKGHDDEIAASDSGGDANELK